MQKKEPVKCHIGHRAVHLAALAYASVSRLFPLQIWLLIGKYLGRFFYILDFAHRRISRRNLRFAFGNHSLVQVEGKEHLDAARRKSRSVILLGAHFGNWEYAHAYYASTINTLNFIVRSIDNPLLEKERVLNNQRFGVRILYKENGLRQAIRRLKNGEDLVIFADRKQTFTRDIPCRFFDRKTSTMTLVPVLARKYRVPVVPMFIVRDEDLVHHRLLFFPELEVRYDDDKEQCISEAAQRQSNMIETSKAILTTGRGSTSGGNGTIRHFTRKTWPGEREKTFGVSRPRWPISIFSVTRYSPSALPLMGCSETGNCLTMELS